MNDAVIDLELNSGPPLADPMLDSLYRRMRTMHSLYYQAVDTMDLEHVNHFEREGVLPIAFSLFHYVNVHDGSFMMITGEPPIWNDEWQERRAAHDRRPRQGETGRRDGRTTHRRLRGLQGLPACGVRAHRGISGSRWIRPISLGCWFAKPYPPVVAIDLQRRAVPARRASPCSTGSSAGCTSTVFATWARSSWRVAWSASAG